jgi:hypothetical protein
MLEPSRTQLDDWKRGVTRKKMNSAHIRCSAKRRGRQTGLYSHGACTPHAAHEPTLSRTNAMFRAFSVFSPQAAALHKNRSYS